MLRCVAVYCGVLRFVAVCWAVAEYGQGDDGQVNIRVLMVCFGMLRRVAVCCGVLQYVTVWCSVVQCV